MSDPADTRVYARCRKIQWFFQPLLAPMLGKQKIMRVFVGVGILQIALTAAGMRGWPCPIDTLFGVACPGCRLSTALTSLIQGKWQAAVQLHVFATLVLAGLMAFAIFSVLPVEWQTRAAYQIAVLESKTGIVAAMILSSLLYWVLRCVLGF